MTRRAVVAAAAVAALLTVVPAAPADAAYVDYVVDGDTIRLRSGEYVRLIGIDTPEVGECGYRAAKRALDRMIGSRVSLPNPITVDDRDHYGRLLRYVRVDGRDSGVRLIRMGLADARYDSYDGYDWHPRQTSYHIADEAHQDVCR